MKCLTPSTAADSSNTLNLSNTLPQIASVACAKTSFPQDIYFKATSSWFSWSQAEGPHVSLLSCVRCRFATRGHWINMRPCRGLKWGALLGLGWGGSVGTHHCFPPLMKTLGKLEAGWGWVSATPVVVCHSSVWLSWMISIPLGFFHFIFGVHFLYRWGGKLGNQCYFALCKALCVCLWWALY